MQGESKPLVQRVGTWLYALASAVLALVAFHPNVRPHFPIVDLCCDVASLPNCLGMVFFNAVPNWTRRYLLAAKSYVSGRRSFSTVWNVLDSDATPAAGQGVMSVTPC